MCCVLCPPQTLLRSSPVVQAAFGGDWAPLKARGPLALVGASPPDACSGLNRAAVQGRVVLAVRGGCYFS